MKKEIQLIYLSDLLPGKEADLPDILATAVRRNAQVGITGMLLYSSGNVMQVLEGEYEAVHSTFERIARDPRHCNLRLLSEQQITERSFPDWTMGCKHLASDALERMPRFAPFFRLGAKLNASQVKPGLAREMLEFFSQES